MRPAIAAVPLALIALCAITIAGAAPQPPAGAASGRAEPHYRLDVKLDPATHVLDVSAVVELPPANAAGGTGAAARSVEFLLAAPLEIIESEPRAEKLARGAGGGFTGINGSSREVSGSDRATRWRVQLPAGRNSIELHYRGPVDFGFETAGQEYARGFNETAGLIRSEGVYLAGATLWYPYLGEALFDFELSARGPEGWQLISPGTGSARGPDGAAHWRSESPVDELHIVGGPLVRYSRPAGPVTAEVYLHAADDALAAKYLEATARNLEMYRGLIGPYPYGKFALVENFWETGYGMPSFTLLGHEIIRFPFILTSSYPHEILHNWWGNGVFVDYASGNWCEGLTAYLADHLYKEQDGQGAEYRRDTLKKYRDFVREGHDFPLREFRSRHSAATEAVGYGKALMTFHMTRRLIGDEAFAAGLKRFYAAQRGKRARFEDLATAFNVGTDRDLPGFYRQWVTRAGAPDLRVAKVTVAGDAQQRHVVRGELQQVQRDAPFRLEVPIAVRTGKGVELFRVATTTRSTPFEFRTADEPIGLDVDPEFDVFRLLDARETAPSLGQMIGDPQVLAVLPAAASPEALAAYRAMIEFWGAGGTQKIEQRRDTELKELPADRAVWIFGRDNTYAAKLFAAQKMPGPSGVVVLRHPRNVARAVAWIVADPLEAAPGLARKLPHYGKYSWLGFTGTEPTNSAKGEWTADDSPLHLDLRKASAAPALPPVKYPARQALAQLPAVFSAARLLEHVQWLADPAREGRGLESAGIDAAANYIADAFRAAGLEPATPGSKSYFQDFTFVPAVAAASTGTGSGAAASAISTGGARPPIGARNVIGVLRGADPNFAGQAIVVSAHYDHLGRSGPGVRSADFGQIHPGADDNASGVAVLIELARTFAGSGARPPRTIVFIAFSGEESGLQGSKYYVQHPVPVPLTGIRAVLNMDTVGRLGANDVTALATGTAREWPPVFQGIGFETGIKVRSLAGASQSSDQQSFIDHGIPGVQLFSGVNFDYHRPSDTADKIDAEGMVKVAIVAREAVDYLAQRAAPLTVTIAGTAAAPGASAGANAGAGAPAAEPQRRVSFGLVPDYAFSGPGVRGESVVPDSPAAKAGIGAGDILIAIDDSPIADLGAFAAKLKQLEPGDKVVARVRSADGAEHLRTVELQER
jgi:hypothetical protein